ncbi:MAG TPA: TonB-dependent receptor [Steroidobacteraceae bacterium]|nr:TonB-dependent receptor [Steroidobacteraceae bacterium]
MSSVRSKKALAGKSLLTAAILAVLAPALHAQQLAANTAAATQPSSALDEVIVTGTRQVGQKAADSPAPIQILSAAQLQSAGKPDLIQTLAAVVPSFTAQGFGGDFANQTLQAKLRGLSPNHVLVLVDGKRRHTTSNLAILGGPFQLGAGVDLNFIPVSAIDHIEVLTEGAAAQYGTDAIAGVINIILKKDSSGGSIGANYGAYEDGGGLSGGANANVGFQPYDGAYINLTAEVQNHGHSDRGGIDPRVVDPANLAKYPDSNMIYQPGYPYLNHIQGDAQSNLKILSYNSGFALGDGATELYSFGTYGRKEAKSYENYRLPDKSVYTDPTTGETVYQYPYGFNPQEASGETDYSVTAGLKGDIVGWNWDLASAYGVDKIDVSTITATNISIFAATGASPTNFYDGQFKASQWTTTLDLNRDFDVGLAGPLNVAFGGESRRDTYQIKAGNAASYFGAGAASFPGLTPSDATERSRKNYAGYVDLAAKPIDGLRVDAAGRYEHYTDFGNATVGKLTARYDFTPAVALRGTVSTGFRAPTLAEESYTNVNVGPTTAYIQLAPNSAAASFLGLGSGLKPEKSTNYSFGVVLHPMDKVSATLDVFQISIKNRIMASGQLNGSITNTVTNPDGTTTTTTVDVSPAVNEAIVATGNHLDPTVRNTGVNIFANGADTRTRGADFVLDYNDDYSWGHVDWSIGATYNSTTLTSLVATPAALAGQQLFDQVAVSDITTASPKYVINLGGAWTMDKFSVTLREVIYGPSSEWENDNADTNGASVVYYQDKIGVMPVTNLDIGYEALKGLRLSIGANNLFDRYPNKQNSALLKAFNSADDNSAVAQYPGFSPIGFNGGYYYLRANYRF